MPISSLEDLFREGGQFTVQSVLERPTGSPAAAVDALRRRFGEALDLSGSDLRLFVGLIIGSMRAADIINQGGIPSPADVPIFEGIDSEYLYTVLVSVIDPTAPDDPSRRIEVPFTVPASEPLTLEQLRQEIGALLTDWQPPRDTIPGGPATDLIRRDNIIKSRIMGVGGEAEDLFSVGVIGVYRR
jgi:hypothetical protein